MSILEKSKDALAQTKTDVSLPALLIFSVVVVFFFCIVFYPFFPIGMGVAFTVSYNWGVVL